MDTLQTIISHILHLDNYLITIAATYGNWTYAILFLIIFSETGLVIAPFLPGDSLLFATGALAAHPSEILNVHWLFSLLTLASILGNTVNYYIGRYIGPHIFHSQQSWLFNKNYLEQARLFYDKHGGKTIILARFIPIIRTFGPFVAGIGRMHSAKFFIYNIAGAFAWVGGLIYISYFFGNLPLVKENFSIVILAIIFISLLPAAATFCLSHKTAQK